MQHNTWMQSIVTMAANAHIILAMGVSARGQVSLHTLLSPLGGGQKSLQNCSRPALCAAATKSIQCLLSRRLKDWDISNWQAMYHDLPSKQTKVSVRVSHLCIINCA